jgi:glutamine synthetase
MVDMATHDLVPAVFSYIKVLGDSVVAAKSAVASADTGIQEKLIGELSLKAREMYETAEALSAVVEESRGITDAQAAATFYKEKALPLMKALRAAADEAEKMMGTKYYPYPTYGDILFSVQ